MTIVNQNAQIPEHQFLITALRALTKKQEQPVYHTLDDLCIRYHKSRATIYRRIADGTLPPGKRFGGGRIWSDSELLEADEKLKEVELKEVTSNDYE